MSRSIIFAASLVSVALVLGCSEHATDAREMPPLISQPTLDAVRDAKESLEKCKNEYSEMEAKGCEEALEAYKRLGQWPAAPAD